MKRNIILTITILTLMLLSGCGKTDDEKILYPITEKKTTEQVDGVSSENAGPETEGSKEEISKTEQTEPLKPNVQENETQQKSDTENTFRFADVADQVFYFSSGAGGWSSELHINSDGSFKGNYHDSDMGDIGDAYPNGSFYLCSFTGRFDNLEQIDAFTCKMNLVSIQFDEEPDKEEIIDGVRYIYSTAYGLDNGKVFYLYLKGAPLNKLPQEYLQWVGYYNLDIVSETTLPFYGLYNVNTGDGFSSYTYEEQSLSERIAMEISITEERAAQLELKLQEASTQTDMDTIGAELLKAWDDTLNIVWKLLESELSKTDMDSLRAEERAWIASKEEAVNTAGQEFEGGSMQSLAKALKAAELTKERVYELAEYAG